MPNEMTRTHSEFISDDQIREMDTDSLKALIVKHMGRTAQHLMMMAKIAVELEGRGVDLSELRIWMANYVRMIAAGQLSAEAVIHFSENQTLLKKVATLPIEKQRELATGNPVMMVVRSAIGYDHRLVDPLKMMPSQIHQVFTYCKIRDKQEQINWLDAKRNLNKEKEKKKSKRVQYDNKTGELRVGKHIVEHEEVLEALSERHSHAENEEAERTKTVSVSLTREEERMLGRKAADAGVTKPEMVRRAMRATGLI